jgi:hypothetical protein
LQSCAAMNCGIFDVRFGGGPGLFVGFGAALRNDALLAFPFRLECHTASDAAALPASMNGLGRRPLPAAISSMQRPEATDWTRTKRTSPRSSRPLAARALRCCFQWRRRSNPRGLGSLVQLRQRHRFPIIARRFPIVRLKRFPSDLNRGDSQRLIDERIFVH